MLLAGWHANTTLDISASRLKINTCSYDDHVVLGRQIVLHGCRSPRSALPDRTDFTEDEHSEFAMISRVRYVFFSFSFFFFFRYHYPFLPLSFSLSFSLPLCDSTRSCTIGNEQSFNQFMSSARFATKKRPHPIYRLSLATLARVRAFDPFCSVFDRTVQLSAIRHAVTANEYDGGGKEGKEERSLTRGLSLTPAIVEWSRPLGMFCNASKA